MQEVSGISWIRLLPVRTPTLPPATHTNVYVLGRGRVAVVDPASPYPEERAALDAALDALRSAGEEVAEVLLTHHHVDHVSGAAHLAARLGVPIRAHAETAARLGGRASPIEVDQVIEDGALLPYGPDGTRALHTPGHAPGHLCFADVRSGALVAGDMVASVGTIIVEPSDGGDMAVYLESLRALRARAPSALLPAHGPPLEGQAALDKLDFYVAHRLEREARVFEALSGEPRSLSALVPAAYPDVPPAIYPLAERSLLAHLLKLAREGRAVETEGLWRRS